MTPQQLTLPPAVTSVPVARRFVGDCLTSLGAGGACEDAEVLVSELATNAVLHARTPFTVEVSRAGRTVRVRVLDLSPAHPRVRDYGTEATTGRGMRLVASIAVAWGTETTRPGKAVWFELASDGIGLTAPSWDEHADVAALLARFDDRDDAAPGTVARAA